mgnify:CR=1 FL=1|tara:strand:- start:7600 stop:7788 length:189 start_codon:yes stop_codon:yes gene_type:complete
MIEENKTPKEVAPDGQIMLDENGLPPMRTKRESVNWDYVITLDTKIGSPLPDWNERNNQESN